MDRTRTVPPRRSCLSVPAVERTLSKLPQLRADEIVIDLEDSVPAADKEEARSRALAALAAAGSIGPAIAVRVNPIGSPWGEQDLEALAGAEVAPHSVVVPKLESGSELDEVERRLRGLEGGSGRAEGIALQALIETAAGIAHVEEIAASGERLEAVIIGYADLAASLGRGERAAADPQAWAPLQDRVLVAARAAGVQALDGPFLGVEVDAGFRRAAEHARERGFDGKWAIHPRQAPVLDELFSPTAEETARARRVLERLRASERDGEGAVAVDGEMIDEASRKRAQRVLAMAELSG